MCVSTVDTFVLFVCFDVDGQTDVTVDSLALCFVFGKFRAHNLAQQPHTMIVDFVDFLGHSSHMPKYCLIFDNEDSSV